MKGNRLAICLGTAVLLAAAALPAAAADVVVCYGPLETAPTGTTGTQYYPQLTNNTRFTCRASGVTYTMQQLVQNGWKLNQVVPVMHSTVYQANGYPVSRTRQQAIFSK